MLTTVQPPALESIEALELLVGPESVRRQANSSPFGSDNWAGMQEKTANGEHPLAACFALLPSGHFTGLSDGLNIAPGVGKSGSYRTKPESGPLSRSSDLACRENVLVDASYSLTRSLPTKR